MNGQGEKKKGNDSNVGISIDISRFEWLVDRFQQMFKKTLIETNGEVISTAISSGGTKLVHDSRANDNEKVTVYAAIKIKDQVILEPIGQYGNATYVIPYEYMNSNEKLKERLTEMRHDPNVTFLYHTKGR